LFLGFIMILREGYYSHQLVLKSAASFKAPSRARFGGRSSLTPASVAVTAVCTVNTDCQERVRQETTNGFWCRTVWD
jgi:hypothetical protein